MLRSWLGIYVHTRFCNTDIEDIVVLHESIQRLKGPFHAPISSAPDEPYKQGLPFLTTGLSSVQLAVFIINDQYSQKQVSRCLNILNTPTIRRQRIAAGASMPRRSWSACLQAH